MKKTIIPFLLFLLTIPFTASADPSDPDKMKANIDELSEYFESKGYAFNQLLEDSRFKLIEDITGKFTRAVEIKIESFEDYQGIIKYDVKKQKLEDFLVKYAPELDAAQEKYGIPKHVIAGIIGIESEFGKYKGSYNPFNAYVSMYAEGYRSEWSKAQLEELLIFAKKNDLDILSLESSYAGAMSYAQFIPYSLNRWWVGSDLYYMPNNIFSVANYLSHFYEITGSMEKAVMRYNPSTMYTKVVLELAEEARKLEKTR
ncbi:lytic murein transglycosylase [Gracilimonas sp.]|uniref:lytic murein transglycosylase n=1 Tax=Gracilimonas sp. TaxID=1974203 RepID=UPI0025C3C23F|nr:lytic murein transglycosylase [Gracilimonas sp.]